MHAGVYIWSIVQLSNFRGGGATWVHWSMAETAGHRSSGARVRAEMQVNQSNARKSAVRDQQHHLPDRRMIQGRKKAQGVWGGRSYLSLVCNGSAERIASCTEAETAGYPNSYACPESTRRLLFATWATGGESAKGTAAGIGEIVERIAAATGREAGVTGRLAVEARNSAVRDRIEQSPVCERSAVDRVARPALSLMDHSDRGTYHEEGKRREEDMRRKLEERSYLRSLLTTTMRMAV